ncbi:phytanoyl-CoA dioxygenase family protein [Micromonospora zamorensis]|uniref:phytanoyl-CoA dioxygenase family protein n=1 Tax=Micromonospora zamorensis TaxID=709883 RepID=UPI003D911ECB
MRVSPAQTGASPAHPTSTAPDEVPVEALGDLYRDGITACRDAFDVAWVDQVGEDVAAAFDEARSRPDGAVGRGPQRWYVEIHPEELRGFVELVTQPWVVSVCQAVLGPEYEIVELGFDIPFPGAAMQPWHRDFPMPEETRRQRRLTSLAFNLTTVDTVEEMGPFEIAPGTQWDHGADFHHEMFPPRERYPRYQQRAVRKYPRRGDISARSALTIHRGTPNVSRSARPVLVLGVDAPGAGNAAHHDMAVTRSYWESLPPLVREHLFCPVVDRLEPIRQKHTIEGLVMGAAE